jgi:hypothetical protein
MINDRNSQPAWSGNEVARLIARYRASGLALKRFARENGLPPGRLHYWLYQKHRAAAPRQVSKPLRTVVRPVFQEVKLTTGASLVEGWAAEVQLPQGMAVRFSATAMPTWIGSVIQALQGPC